MPPVRTPVLKLGFSGEGALKTAKVRGGAPSVESYHPISGPKMPGDHVSRSRTSEDGVAPVNAAVLENRSTFHECPPQAALSSHASQPVAASFSVPLWRR